MHHTDNRRAAVQIPLYAGYALTVNVLLPWWRQPKIDDMPETGERRSGCQQGRPSCAPRSAPPAGCAALTGHSVVPTERRKQVRAPGYGVAG